LIGLYCILLALSMVTHKQATVDVVKAILQSPPLGFIVGAIAMVAGLAIVLSHNVWSGGAAPVIVTILGWAALIKGLLFLILPPNAQSGMFIVANHFERLFYLYAAMSIVLGAWMTYEGFAQHRAE
jgi:vacuolar-type H+-ATPase subunit I/STV1